MDAVQALRKALLQPLHIVFKPILEGLLQFIFKVIIVIFALIEHIFEAIFKIIINIVGMAESGLKTVLEFVFGFIKVTLFPFVIVVSFIQLIFDRILMVLFEIIVAGMAQADGQGQRNKKR